MKPSPHSLNHSLSSLPLPHSFNYISHLCLSPSSLSQLSPDHNSLSQSLSASLTLSLHLCLIAVTLITSLPHRRHSYSIASLPSLQGTLFFLILLSFMSIYIFWPIFFKLSSNISSVKFVLQCVFIFYNFCLISMGL